jgi:hypothetical protein
MTASMTPTLAPELGFSAVDERGFVEALRTAMPEAFADSSPSRRGLEADDPLAYAALGDARIWLEDHAIKVAPFAWRARVRRGQEDVVRRFWGFVEQRAQAGAGDSELETLLYLECFEGNAWVEHLSDYLGPRTRLLYNGEL